MELRIAGFLRLLEAMGDWTEMRKPVIYPILKVSHQLGFDNHQ